MDSPRAPRTPRRPKARVLTVGAIALCCAATAVWYSTSAPAAPIIARSSLLIDTVVRGDVVHDIRAPGALVPVSVQYLTAQTSARVERLLADPGSRVRAGDIVMILSNPDVLTRALEAEQRVAEAQIDLANLRSALRLQALSQEGVVASMTTQAAAATDGQRISDSLARYRFVSQVEFSAATRQAGEMSTRLRIERERLDVMRAAIAEQLDAKREQIKQLQAIAASQRQRLQSLEVRAPTSGVLQDLDLQLGQWVPEGATLARIIQPEQLKAILRVAESEATAVQLGQSAMIDLRNVIIPGRVARKSAGAVDGTIPVEIALPARLPAGAVPELSIDGTIQLDVIPNALGISRPPLSAPNAVVTLFKLTADGTTAVRVRVQLGAVTTSRAEVRAGLVAGDRIIISDMSAFATTDRVRLQ